MHFNEKMTDCRPLLSVGESNTFKGTKATRVWYNLNLSMSNLEQQLAERIKAPI